MKQREFSLSAEAILQFEKREQETREALELMEKHIRPVPEADEE